MAAKEANAEKTSTSIVGQRVTVGPLLRVGHGDWLRDGEGDALAVGLCVGGEAAK
jgi:hypothetical protein